MKFHMFVREGFAVHPKSRWAYLPMLFAAAFLIYAFVDINGHSHSASDCIRNCVFMTAIVGVCFYLFALLTSRRET